MACFADMELSAIHDTAPDAADQTLPSFDGSFRQLSSSTPQKQGGKFTSKLYDYSTVRLYNFQRHGAKHVVSKTLLCNVCGKDFKSQKGLKLHILAHQDKFKYKCKVCGEGYNLRSYLKKIHLSSHVEQKNISEENVKNEYRHLKDLVYYRRHVHMGVTYKCKLCKIKFSKNDSLNEHRRTAHDGRRYFCQVCNKKNKKKTEMRSFKSNENIHKKEGGSYYVVSANKASSMTL